MRMIIRNATDMFSYGMSMGEGLKSRFTAAGVHLGVSLFVAMLAALLVFRLWYPYPYNEISGGSELFLLIVAVDVVLGPLLTLAVFNVAKKRRDLIQDVLIIAALQFAALAYGLWAVFIARPVYLVHEVDRFQVVIAADIDPVELRQAPPELRDLPLWGVRTIGVRNARDSEEMLKSIGEAMVGKDVSMRPAWWVPLGPSQRAILAEHGKPVDSLRTKGPEAEQRVGDALKKIDAPESELLAFPVVARIAGWSVLINRKSQKVEGFVQVDGF
jgi:hypothetical protein